MHLTVVDPAQRDDELVAGLLTECARLSEPEVVRIGGMSTTHETRLQYHEPEMLFVAIPTRLGKSKNAFVDGPRPRGTFGRSDFFRRF